MLEDTVLQLRRAEEKIKAWQDTCNRQLDRIAELERVEGYQAAAIDGLVKREREWQALGADTPHALGVILDAVRESGRQMQAKIAKLDDDNAAWLATSIKQQQRIAVLRNALTVIQDAVTPIITKALL